MTIKKTRNSTRISCGGFRIKQELRAVCTWFRQFVFTFTRISSKANAFPWTTKAHGAEKRGRAKQVSEHLGPVLCPDFAFRALSHTASLSLARTRCFSTPLKLTRAIRTPRSWRRFSVQVDEAAGGERKHSRRG
ncbi:hypothetical protein AOLI_G00246290 [Acnodon oligacanthus]